MIDNHLDGNNPKLTPEQARSLEEAKTRLLNIETEVSIATKNFKSIKLETERITNEKTYQEGLLEKAMSKVNSLSTEIDTLSSRKETLFGEISAAVGKLSELTASYAQKEIELNEKISVVESRENDLVSHENSLIDREKNIKESELSLQDKHSRIIAFSQSIK